MGQKFSIDNQVSIKCSNEQGEVIGIAEYANSESQALVRYVSAEGTACEKWWDFSALELSEETFR